MDAPVAQASPPARRPAAGLTVSAAQAGDAGGDACATKGLYALLMARAAGLPNDDLFARMLVSQAGAQSALPAGLGLESSDFRALMTRHFPEFGLPAPLARAPDLGERSAEWDDLLALLMEHRAGADASETWMALIVATACMGGDHLWQDLGLWSRADLTKLMAANFPGLTALNSRDMKWKRFLYKQLCGLAGVYVCRSPSCEVCVDYAKCFGPA
ncbi:MAG: nitrogen fixation protein NifQ [Pseudomonadota bacterium]|nr:nitrogen fixation protein NifQ [Pseudomonadota bacterium]